MGWWLRGSGERGAVALLVVLALPVLVLLMVSVLNTGFVVVARQKMSSAADMGALAGLHALDLEKLYLGQRYVDPEEGSALARTWTLDNLKASFPTAEDEDIDLVTRVLNPVASRQEGGVEDPTVEVDLSLNLELPWPFGRIPGVNLRVKARSAVRERE
jgi:hypothetical protein